MKFIVIGKSAVLATRGIERIDPENTTKVYVENVPDGATISFVGDDVHSYAITSESTDVDFASFPVGTYQVSVNWETTDDDDTNSYEAIGNPIKISTDENGDYVLPAPLATASNIEYAWQAISDILGVLMPLEDDFKNGINVI